MKKILFNDKFGLTKAVLEGRKTMTRRIVPEKQLYYIRRHFRGLAVMEAPFKYDEVVAVAQSYMDAGYDPHMLQFIDIKEPTILPFSDGLPVLGYVEAPIMYHAGWKNKMFVHPTMMPHQIRITNIKVERLQDISDEDCIKEGIMDVPFCQFSWEENGPLFGSPREAFAALIDKVSGKGTWGRNPWVFVYEFELVK